MAVKFRTVKPKWSVCHVNAPV